MYFVTIFTVLSDTLISLQCRSNVTQETQASSQKNNDHHSKVRKFLQPFTNEVVYFAKDFSKYQM